MNDGLIYLVRHGEAAAKWGQDPDPGLSERGREQAEQAAGDLRARFIDGTITLVSSPLRRAQETAAPLSARLDAAVRVDERFREIPSPVPLAQRQDWLRGFMREQWDEQPETLWHWREAMLRGLSELPPGTVVFTHFLVINTVVGALEREDRTLVFWPANASITTLERRDGECRVIALGESMQSRVN